MKSFKSYIAKSRLTTYEEVVNAIASYKKVGEILNPAYQDLVNQVRRVFGNTVAPGRNAILDLLHKGDRDETLDDLYYAWPDNSFVTLGKIEKLAAKLKPEHKSIASLANDFVKKWKPVADDLKDLKSKVVKVTQKRAEAKVAAATSMGRKFADSSSLIKIFESHLKEYKDMAKTRATEFVNDKLEILKKAGWDIDKVAPRADRVSRYGTGDYKTASAKRSLYSSITKSKSDNYHVRGEPNIVGPDRTMIERYIDTAVKGAEESYRNFMGKMIQKIGKPVIDAKMTGNIWTNAILTVTTDDGEEQVWNTKMILNFSKYQTMFNQFPSRRKK